MRVQPWKRMDRWMDKQVNGWTKDVWTGGWMGRGRGWPYELKRGQEVWFLWSLNHRVSPAQLGGDTTVHMPLTSNMGPTL